MFFHALPRPATPCHALPPPAATALCHRPSSTPLSTQRALSGLSTLLTGRHPDETPAGAAPPADADADWLGGLGHSLAKLLQPREHAATTAIASAWRAYKVRTELTEQQSAAVELQVHARRLTAQREVMARRGAYLAAVLIQRWVRGYIDRQWVGMVREEMELLRIAAEEAEAQQRYSAKTNRRDKVKRAFSFKRKKQRNENQQSANAPAAATPAAALSAIKRSFSFGRRSRGEKENAPAAAPYVDTLGMGDDEPVLAPREQVIEARPANDGLKRTFSWSRKSERASSAASGADAEDRARVE